MAFENWTDNSPHLPLSVALHAEHKTYLIGNVAKIENSFPTFVVVRINLFRRRWGLIDERNARDTFSSMIVNEGFLASLFKKPLGLLGQRSPFLITSMTTVSRVGPYEAVVTVGVVRRLTRQTLLSLLLLVSQDFSVLKFFFSSGTSTMTSGGTAAAAAPDTVQTDIGRRR